MPHGADTDYSFGNARDKLGVLAGIERIPVAVSPAPLD